MLLWSVESLSLGMAQDLGLELRPEAVSAAGRRARAGRRPTASGKQEAGGGGRGG